MKSVVISVLMFSLAFIFVNCENEGQLTESASDVETQILDKKPHDGDLIIFQENNNLIGDLEGNQIVMGCCPNAGPSPEYTMTMSDNFPVEFRGEHTGYVYMNGFGRHLPWAYKVQFWWGGEEEYFIEIRGGTVTKDKKSRILTARFTQEDTCWTWDPNGVERIIFIDFTLIRDPLKFNH
jgi:hypothetical protein